VYLKKILCSFTPEISKCRYNPCVCTWLLFFAT
jgi:hypothetical protein